MPKCKTVKNPCKICLAPVSQKNGLKCQGACQSWLHYGCLNYTPGKINDIKAGLIKVSCPCPDCKTTSPKEIRTNEPFSCTNTRCPANLPPHCVNEECPTNNTKKPLKLIDTCGKSCKPNSTPHNTPKPIPQHHFSPQMCPTESDPCIKPQPCPSGCSSLSDVPGDHHCPADEVPSLGTLETMCNTVGQLSEQINELMNKMKDVQEKQRPTCAQKGPSSLCQKPCNCPGNPGCKR